MKKINELFAGKGSYIVSGATVLKADEPYDGYARDLKLLRDHFDLKSNGKTIKASSGKAGGAAQV